MSWCSPWTRSPASSRRRANPFPSRSQWAWYSSTSRVLGTEPAHEPGNARLDSLGIHAMWRVLLDHELQSVSRIRGRVGRARAFDGEPHARNGRVRIGI